MDDQERLRTEARVDELNALAIADNLADLRATIDAKFDALENELETLKGVITGMQTTIGNTLQQVWGNGSTTRE